MSCQLAQGYWIAGAGFMQIIHIETFARIIIAIRTVKIPLSESIKYQNSPKQQEFSEPQVFWFSPPLSTYEFGVTFLTVQT
jgi:hypothetical protein